MAGLSQDDRLGAKLIARHDQRWRRYHGLAHLRFLFDEIDTVRAEITDRPRLVFTTWFHDAIYITWRKDNEARSADWAKAALARLGASDELASNVSRLIRLTADHAQGGRDHDDDLFLDMDCAILGAPPEVYAAYAKAVRAEHWWVPVGAYRKERRAFLERQLKREPLFLTETYQARFGAQARANMKEELDRL
jgi:predicted metal-dependent HD superfamily phosphohydrolase